MKWIQFNGQYKIDEEFYSKIANEVIDLLRKNHQLDPMECQFVLDNLSMSLTETIRSYRVFDEPNKSATARGSTK